MTKVKKLTIFLARIEHLEVGDNLGTSEEAEAVDFFCQKEASISK